MNYPPQDKLSHSIGLIITCSAHAILYFAARGGELILSGLSRLGNEIDQTDPHTR